MCIRISGVCLAVAGGAHLSPGFKDNSIPLPSVPHTFSLRLGLWLWLGFWFYHSFWLWFWFWFWLCLRGRLRGHLYFYYLLFYSYTACSKSRGEHGDSVKVSETKEQEMIRLWSSLGELPPGGAEAGKSKQLLKLQKRNASEWMDGWMDG